jgi:hypothetical protein
VVNPRSGPARMRNLNDRSTPHNKKAGTVLILLIPENLPITGSGDPSHGDGV